MYRGNLLKAKRIKVDMGYTSYIESDLRLPPSDASLPRYDSLDFCLRVWGEMYKDLYVLTTLMVGDPLATEINRLEGILVSVPMGKYIDFLVAGPEDRAKAIGEQIHRITGNHVGGIHYRTDRLFTQVEAEWAREEALQQGKAVYIAELRRSLQELGLEQPK